MGKLFAWLDRTGGETVRDYDNRINHLQAFHAGYAFLSLENYHKELSAFAAYAVWNGEFNEKLDDPLPTGGFMLHCDLTTAQKLCARPEGFPVFVKLYAKRGHLFADAMTLAAEGQVFDFYFNGCEVIPPEHMDLVFAGARKPENAHYDESLQESSTPVAGKMPGVTGTAAGSYSGGKMLPGSYWHGSYWKGSYQKGRYQGGSYQSGSYRGGAFATGSYWQGSSAGFGYAGGFGIGSYLYGSYWRGSYRAVFYRSLWQGSYIGGSFQNWWQFFGGSYAQARFGIGSYIGGSFRVVFGRQGSFWQERFGTGSFGPGSFRLRAFRKGSFWNNGSGFTFLSMQKEPMPLADNGAEEAEAKTETSEYADAERARHRYRYIEEMGYGLDLI